MIVQLIRHFDEATSFGEFFKGSEQQMNQQLNRIDEKYEQKYVIHAQKIKRNTYKNSNCAQK